MTEKHQKKLKHMYNKCCKKIRQNLASHATPPNESPKFGSVPSERAIIYRSELDFVSRCILDYPNIETGGQMFGFWTEDGTPVVLYTIGPGPQANHQSTFFNQDLRYLETVGNVLTQKYGLKHIGEWHSHHQLSLARPSGHDASTMANGLQSSRRSRFLLCIGNCTSTKSSLNPFNFTVECGTKYNEARWQVNQIDSPFRMIIDTELRSMLFFPNMRQANYEGMEKGDRKPPYESSYWLSNKENNLALKSIMDFLNQDSDVANLKLMLDDNKHVNLTCFWRREFPTIIYFPAGFPVLPPQYKVCRTDGRGSSIPCTLQLPEWNYKGDILKSFVEYYNNVTIL